MGGPVSVEECSKGDVLPSGAFELPHWTYPAAHPAGSE